VNIDEIEVYMRSVVAPALIPWFVAIFLMVCLLAFCGAELACALRRDVSEVIERKVSK